MSIQVQVIGHRELAAALAGMPAVLSGNVKDAIVASQYDLQRETQRLISGPLLKNRTGHLRQSIVLGPVEESTGSIKGSVGTNIVYARIQEEGGTIVPKTAQYLTVPLDAVLTDNGVARYTAAELISNPGLGSFTGTFVRNGILFGKTGRDITPLFSLKKSVTINAHRYMAAALAAVKPQVEERLETALSEVMKKE